MDPAHTRPTTRFSLSVDKPITFGRSTVDVRCIRGSRQLCRVPPAVRPSQSTDISSRILLLSWNASLLGSRLQPLEQRSTDHDGVIRRFEARVSREPQVADCGAGKVPAPTREFRSPVPENRPTVSCERHGKVSSHSLGDPEPAASAFTLLC